MLIKASNKLTYMSLSEVFNQQLKAQDDTSCRKTQANSEESYQNENVLCFSSGDGTQYNLLWETSLCSDTAVWLGFLGTSHKRS